MTPEDFRRHFEAAIAGEPDLVTTAAADTAVVRGGRTVRRRRVGAIVLAVAMVVGLGTAIDLVQHASRNEEPAPAPSSTPTPSADDSAFPTDDEVIQLCRAAEKQDRPYTRRVFASGTPTIKVVSGSDVQLSAALESADGRWWGWCRLTLGDPSESGMDLYSRDGIGDGGLSGSLVDGLTCANQARRDPGPCATFAFRWARHLAPRVASIEFEMADGKRLEFDTANGYIAVDYLGRLPTPVRGDEAAGFQSYRSVVYRNARGQVIAATPERGDLPHPQRIHTRGHMVGALVL